MSKRQVHASDTMQAESNGDLQKSHAPSSLLDVGVCGSSSARPRERQCQNQLQYKSKAAKGEKKSINTWGVYTCFQRMLRQKKNGPPHAHTFT